MDNIFVTFVHGTAPPDSFVRLAQDRDVVVVDTVDELDSLVETLHQMRPFLARKIVAVEPPKHNLMAGVCGLALDDEENDR